MITLLQRCSALLAAALMMTGCVRVNAAYPGYYNIFGLIILVLVIIAVLDVLKHSWSTEKKLVWILLIVVIPVLGLLLYYFIARNKGGNL